MASDDALAVLQGARALLDSPERWTQGGWAVDADGVRCSSPYDSQAAAWCVRGAIDRTAGARREDLRIDAEEAFGKALPPRYRYWLARWNDARTRTHAHVLRALDRAIARLRAGGSDGI